MHCYMVYPLVDSLLGHCSLAVRAKRGSGSTLHARRSRVAVGRVQGTCVRYALQICSLNCKFMRVPPILLAASAAGSGLGPVKPV